MIDTDDMLVARLAHGDLGALDTIVSRHQDALVRITRVVTGDDALANDAAQEAFVRLWRNPQAFVGGTLRAWLITVARNVALNELRAARRRTARHDKAATRPASDPALKVAGADRLAQVRAFIDTLPEAERTALVLFAVEGMSQHEIARVLATSEGAVKQAVLSARKKIRERFGDSP